MGAGGKRYPQRVVAIDGKTMRGSYDTRRERGPLHMVSAWAVESHRVLGQVATREKSNEITAIPELLELLDLHGCFATIDAMGCQTAIAEQILPGQADYLLVVKINQPTLAKDLQEEF